MQKHYEALASPPLIHIESHVTTPGEGPGLVIGIVDDITDHYSVGTKTVRDTRRYEAIGSQVGDLVSGLGEEKWF